MNLDEKRRRMAQDTLRRVAEQRRRDIAEQVERRLAEARTAAAGAVDCEGGW